jgi:hypothetical protein
MSITPTRQGRKVPYTLAGIARVGCIRCGRPSRYQWQICSDDRRYRPLCGDCDVELNRMVLTWVGFPDAAEKLSRYISSQG